ncbi:MAG: hypothetical protein NC489_30165 [Ruminococcus flavefaciens]|nr:hypothetical protein [Ruminococcus flavefaciens]
MDENKQVPEENVSNLDITDLDTETEESPEEKLYTQTEVDEIVRQRLEEDRAKAARPTIGQREAEIAARELSMQKREYLIEKVQRWGLDNLPTRASGMMALFSRDNSPYDLFNEYAKTLCGIWEAAEMTDFTKSADAMFDMLDQARSQGYEAGMKDARKEESMVRNKTEKTDIVKEIFKAGGHV